MEDSALSAEAAILLGDDQAPVVEEPEQEPAAKTDEDLSASESTEPEATPEVATMPGTVKELAEKLGIRPQDVYAGLKINIGDSEVSLSEFKDRAKDLFKADELRSAADTHKTDTENELLRTRRELSIAQQRYQPTEAEKQQADTDWNAYVAQENASTLAAIPDWQKPEAQTAGLTAVAELAAEYGFSNAEVQTMVDHRIIKQWHDHAALKARLKKAESSVVKQNRDQSTRTNRKAVATDIDKARQMHKDGKLSTTSMVAALIADGTNQ